MRGMIGAGSGYSPDIAASAEKMAQIQRPVTAPPSYPAPAGATTAQPTRVSDALQAELRMILDRTGLAQERTAMTVARAFGPTPESGNPNQAAGQIAGGSLGEISILLSAINANLAGLHANLDRIEQIV